MDTQNKKQKNTAFIFSAEQKALAFLSKHLLLIAVIAISALGLLIRYALRDFVSMDAYYFLLPWYDTMKDAGLAGLGQPVGNYNILYQFFIALFTYLPMQALHAYKFFSIIFDLLLAFLGMRIVLKNASSHAELKAVITYAAVLLSPLVFFNSACWAQCDVIYTYFCVFALYALYKEKYLPAFILYGVAVTFKLQAIFLLPFLLFYYFYKRKFTILYFLTIPAVMVILSLPGLVMGRGFAEIFTIYTDQTSTYQQMSMNYPSFWTFFQNTKMDESYAVFKWVAMLLTVGILLLFIVLWIKKKVTFTFINVISMAFIMAYTCVLFLPSMHERYGFLYEILAIFIAVWYYRTVPLLLLMYSTAFFSYGHYLFSFDINQAQISFLNVAVYVAYVLYLNRKILADAGSDTSEKLPQETI